MQDDTTFVGGPNEHYVCNYPGCKLNDGSTTQFQEVPDDKIHFPYNQMFVNRDVKSFYRKPYLKVSSVGVTETKK